MTQFASITPNYFDNTTRLIRYEVSMSNPQSHLFEVTLNILDWGNDTLDLKMPVWTPGSYLVREYSRHLQDFEASNTKELLLWEKHSKNHWHIKTEGAFQVTVRYKIYANELTVRTNHLDITHGYFNPAALFCYISGWEDQCIEIKINPPYPDWKVTTALPRINPEQDIFLAADFDALVDSPFEIGTHDIYKFEVLGKSHELAIWGEGNIKVEEVITQIEKIIAVESKIFDGLPYDYYAFILHLSHQGTGGLEHRNSCTLNFNRFNFSPPDKLYRFFQLLSHEFFHLWNVKRIRPDAFELYSYDEENYSTSLWFCEGTTSYYDLLIPLRAGIYNEEHFLNELSKEITNLQTTLGRKTQSLAESSFDAWIKLYRPDSNSGNSGISYYLKGELVTLLLDLRIREKYNNTRSFDDVMKSMWTNFGIPEMGYSVEQLKTTMESVLEEDLTDFYNQYIYGTDELPFDEYFRPFGLKLKVEYESVPYLGIKVKSECGKAIIQSVAINSPAQQAGISPFDELLAIDGFRVYSGNDSGMEQLNKRLQHYEVGDLINITVFHLDQLRTFSVVLDHRVPKEYQIVMMENLTRYQQYNLMNWLSVSI